MNLTLNERLLALGIRLANTHFPKKFQMVEVDIEKTLFDASREFESDARLASLVFTWVNVHGDYVNIEKLKKLRAQSLRAEDHDWISVLAAYAYSEGLQRWKLLMQKSKEPLFLFPRAITESSVRLKGEETWARKVNAIIPRGAIRIRESDIVEPRELIRINPQYKNRYLYGASWRADIITAIETGIDTAAAIARLIGCSYEPAHRVLKEYRLAMG